MISTNHNQHQTQWAPDAGPDAGPDRPLDPPLAAATPHDHSGSQITPQKGHDGSHKWMMLLMCLPLVAIGVWTLASGGGTGTLASGLACMAMMFVMHRAMGGNAHQH